MRTRKTRKFRNKTKRGGSGSKKSKSASASNSKFEKIVESINLSNTKYSETGVKTGDVEKLINELERLLPRKGFNEKQKNMLNSILELNAQNTDNCKLLNPRKTDCDFLEGYIERIKNMIEPVKDMTPEPSSASEHLSASVSLPVSLPAPEPLFKPAPVIKQSTESILAKMFEDKYLRFDIAKNAEIKEATDRELQELHEIKEATNRELQELHDLREQIKKQDMCEFMTSLFPSFSVEEKSGEEKPSHKSYRETICILLFLIGKISYILNTNYAFGISNYYILVKGGTALKLMANHPDFKYDSKDIDISIMLRPGFAYDAHKVREFVDGLANYFKWFIDIPEIKISSQTQGMKVTKLHYNRTGLCDIDYQNHNDDDDGFTAYFYGHDSVQTLLNRSHRILFNVQHEDKFYEEKSFLSKKYKEQCKKNNCDKQEKNCDKKESNCNEEEKTKFKTCKECLFLQTKFDKATTAMERLQFFRR